MGKVVITLNVPDGMEDVVKSLLEKEARLIMKRLSRADFEGTFGILKGKKKSVDEIEADIYDFSFFKPCPLGRGYRVQKEGNKQGKRKSI